MLLDFGTFFQSSIDVTFVWVDVSEKLYEATGRNCDKCLDW